ncbi:MAG: hypothetical protein ACRERU_08525 [Methylococcales bacterium]
MDSKQQNEVNEMTWIFILIAFIAGSWVGMFAMAIFQVSADADRIQNEFDDLIQSQKSDDQTTDRKFERGFTRGAIPQSR